MAQAWISYVTGQDKAVSSPCPDHTYLSLALESPSQSISLKGRESPQYVFLQLADTPGSGYREAMTIPVHRRVAQLPTQPPLTDAQATSHRPRSAEITSLDRRQYCQASGLDACCSACGKRMHTEHLRAFHRGYSVRRYGALQAPGSRYCIYQFETDWSKRLALQKYETHTSALSLAG